MEAIRNYDEAFLERPFKIRMNPTKDIAMHTTVCWLHDTCLGYMATLEPISGVIRIRPIHGQ